MDKKKTDYSKKIELFQSVASNQLCDSLNELELYAHEHVLFHNHQVKPCHYKFLSHPHFSSSRCHIRRCITDIDEYVEMKHVEERVAAKEQDRFLLKSTSINLANHKKALSIVSPPLADPHEKIVSNSSSSSLDSLYNLIEIAKRRKNANIRWRKLRLAIMVLSHLAHPDTSIISNINEIEKTDWKRNMQDYQFVSHTTGNDFGNDNLEAINYEEALNAHRLTEKLFSLVAVGDCEQWKSTYQKDPKKKIFDGTSKNSSVNIRNSFGLTQLHVAIQNGDVEMIKCLLEHGADVTISSLPVSTSESCKSETPLALAVRWGQKNAVKVLLDHSDKITAKMISDSLKISKKGIIRDYLNEALRRKKSEKHDSSCCFFR